MRLFDLDRMRQNIAAGKKPAAGIHRQPKPLSIGLIGIRGNATSVINLDPA
ncbi:hypothetical protein [Rhodopirellula sp. SWK7]|uniref:hypothetical protein n=1 Tax=Rhodopirellula sp. SWK7 TaxID=595460 RepID=UPI0002BE8E0F|nr:hypothetical protein [Rhodopirellula sp. SWK7]EMI40616.1 hypothetical protein RRSWK_07025 [Rhodopirellula sp. SWK7]